MMEKGMEPVSLGGKEIEFLEKALPFWKELTQPQRRMIADGSYTKEYPVGSLLHSGPEGCEGLFVIVGGQVRSYILSESGREITVFRLQRGEACIFSLSCMLENIRFDIYMQAAADSRTILIPTPIYRELNRTSLAVSAYTNRELSARFSDVVWLLEQILFVSFDRRLAIFLTQQSALSGGGAVNLTHEEIARDMGTAREVVTRMLRYFQSEGVVQVSRGSVRILDREKLARLAK